MSFITAKQLATLPGFPRSESRARELAKNLGLTSRQRFGRGGGLEYAVASLPSEARTAWEIRSATASREDDGAPAANDAAGAALAGLTETESRLVGTGHAAHVTGWQKQRQDERTQVLVLFNRHWQDLGGARTPAIEAFCKAWESNAVTASNELRQRFPVLSPATLHRWLGAIRKRGLSGITPKANPRKGRYAALAGEVGRAVLAMLQTKPHLSAQAIYEVLSKRFDDLPSDRAFRRALAHWKQQNAQLLEAMTNPDSWRNKYLSAAGSASEGVTAPNQLWEMDSTPGDVMLADNRRHAILGVIDVFTRRRMFMVARTSKSGAIMSLIRRAISEWGVPKAIKTDNGQDYTAQQLDTALLGLGIEHPLCPPFTPMAKPHIERAIGALMHEHFELLEGFIGHDVAQRKGIEARRSFADRLFDTKEPVDLRLTPDELQASVDQYCNRVNTKPRKELGERTPAEMARGFSIAVAPERALDVLLAPGADGGIRVIGKKGIRIGGGWYNHAELGGLEGTEVQVKVDEANLGRAWVFHLDGHYICEALDFVRLGISASEVAAERKAHQAKVLKQQKRELREAAKAFDTRAAIASIATARTDAAVSVADNVVPLQLAPTEHTTRQIASIEASSANVESRQSGAAALAAPGKPAAVLHLYNSPQERYARWLQLSARVDRGEALSPGEAEFVSGYRGGDEWGSMRTYFESFGLSASDVIGDA